MIQFFLIFLLYGFFMGIKEEAKLWAQKQGGDNWIENSDFFLKDLSKDSFGYKKNGDRGWKIQNSSGEASEKSPDDCGKESVKDTGFTPPEAQPPIPQNLLDLDEMIQEEIVLESRRIEIDGYPGSFNPSIVYWKGAYLLCFRIRNPYTGSTNQVGLIWLNRDFHAISNPYVLNFQGFVWKEQDPRLIVVKDHLYIIYSNLLETFLDWETRRVFIAEVEFSDNTFTAHGIQCFRKFPGEKFQRWEKNWVPFNYKEQLLLAYSISPHYILKPRPGEEKCDVCAFTHSIINWDWGTPRGGTPAVLEGDEYLAFFHSSKEMKTVQSEGKKISHYFIGAYTFSQNFPFHVTKMSSKPIVGKHFYDGPSYKTWKPLRVVFPCGFVSDEEHIWIVYGKQDHEIWVAKLDKKALYSSLKPVETLE
jgi:predicted GH43/DUF377 family glycosyl hydrolase